MLRQIWAMTRKELKLWLQRPGQWLTLLLTPLVFVAVLGQVFGGGSAPTVTVYAVNEDGGRAGRQVMDLLQDVKNLELEVLDSRSEADRLVGDGRRVAAIVVPAGFSDALLTPEGAVVEIIVDPAREQSAGMVVGQVSAATAPLLIDAEVTRGVGTALDSAQSSFNLGGDLAESGVDNESFRKFITAALKGVVSSQVQDALDDPLVAVAVVPAGKTGQILRPPTILDYLVPGYTFFFAFFLVGMMAQAIIAERANGTLRRLLVTPASRSTVLLGKILPYFLVVVVQVPLVFGLCSLIFGAELGNSFLGFALMTVSAAAVVAGMGIMIASVVRTEGQAGALPDLVVISMAVVSGAMFPSIRIPGLMYATPHYWAIQGFQELMVRGLGVSAVLDEAGILLGMAALFFAVGVARFKFA